MTNLRKNKNKKVLTAVLTLFVLVLASAPYALDAGVCEKALVKCSVDVVIIGILSGFQSAAIYASGCLLGYSWCLQYYVF